MFEIVSFGTNFEISSKEKTGYANNQENVQQILKEIDSYEAKFGNTNILEPMKFIIENYLFNHWKEAK